VIVLDSSSYCRLVLVFLLVPCPVAMEFAVATAVVAAVAAVAGVAFVDWRLKLLE